MTQEEKDKKFFRNCMIVTVLILFIVAAEVIGFKIYNDWDTERIKIQNKEQWLLRQKQDELKKQENEIQKIANAWTDEGITFDENGRRQSSNDTNVKQVLDEDDDIANAEKNIDNAKVQEKSEEKNDETESTQQLPEATAAEDLFTPIEETVYATSTVNIRSHYSTSGDRLGKLSYGNSIVRTGIGSGEAANWSRVEFDGKTAYINSKYLSTKKPEEVQKTVKVETSSDTNTAPKDGDMKTVDGVQYCYLKGFGWVEYSPGGTGIEVPGKHNGVVVGY